MQTTAPDVIPVLLIGTVIVVILLVFIFLVVVLHQRRMINHQVELRTLHTARQQELFKAVFEAQESERQRLAADLHDSVGQVLSVIKLNLHRLQKMEAQAADPSAPAQALLTETSGLAEDCLIEIRHIIRNILPPLLTNFGLVEALQHLAGKVEKATGIQVVFHASAHVGRYSQEIEVTLYRVAQELFNNAIKHAQATTIRFSVEQEPAWLLLTFADDGVGFRPDHVTPGLGLKNLESRVALLRGELQTGPGPTGGTLTQIRVPLAGPTHSS
ncbi:sensor histidine kinase [Hymenobacter weizhouensis]|uniref:sensor histidine kinase n=1 Tax=Hymenobacter sp. YIM 151500-1 TaxID=2987689 RepID=UPI002226BA62|nr:sensor histidine kinase [Hymenobacter sp. YIM 151500-1]UYZ62109.1 sensor histidine kinase [Hymenobacter sp. YIM 151500-1]